MYQRYSDGMLRGDGRLAVAGWLESTWGQRLLTWSAQSSTARGLVRAWLAHHPGSSLRFLKEYRVHFFWGFPLGFNLLLLGAPLLLEAVPHDIVRLVWQEPSLWPLNWLANWQWGAIFTWGGLAMFADCDRRLHWRLTRVLVWSATWAMLSMLALYASMAMIVNDPHPLGVWSAYVPLFIGHTLLLHFGPALEARPRNVLPDLSATD